MTDTVACIQAIQSENVIIRTRKKCVSCMKKQRREEEKKREKTIEIK